MGYVDNMVWVFTFGCGQQHAGHYVTFTGSYSDARQKMFDAYGDDWCFQYSAQEWKKMNDEHKAYPLETPLTEDDYDLLCSGLG